MLLKFISTHSLHLINCEDDATSSRVITCNNQLFRLIRTLSSWRNYGHVFKIYQTVHTIQSLCIGIDPHPHVNILKKIPYKTSLYIGPLHLLIKQRNMLHASRSISLFEMSDLGLDAPFIIPWNKSLAPVILDAKRGDISSTAAAYTRSCYDHWRAFRNDKPVWNGSSFLNSRRRVVLTLPYFQPQCWSSTKKSFEDGLPLYAWVASKHQQMINWTCCRSANRHTQNGTKICPDARTLPWCRKSRRSIEETIHHGWGKGNLLISVFVHSQADNPSEEPKSEGSDSKMPVWHDLQTERTARLLIKNQCVLFDRSH